MAMKLTVEGLLRALRGKVHEMAEAAELNYSDRVSGTPDDRADERTGRDGGSGG